MACSQTPNTKTKMTCSASSGRRDDPFNNGGLVEVSSDADGFRGVWYEAKVLKRKSKNAFLIEYQTLLADDGYNPLVERVDSAFIRPLPPPDTDDDREFEVNDVIDAFCLDGWWVGVVSQVVLDVESNTKRYRVVFDDPPDLLELQNSNLRAHRDWVDGKWVRSQKRELLNNMECKEQLIGAQGNADNYKEAVAFKNCYGVEGNAAEMGNCSTNSQSTAYAALCAVTSSGKELNQASPMVDSTISRPSKKRKKLKEGGADTPLLLIACHQKSVPTELTIAGCATSSRKNTKSSKEQVIQHKEWATDSEKKRKRGRPPKSLIECKEWDGAACAVDKMVGKDSATSVVELPKITEESTGSGNVLAEAAAELYVTGFSTTKLKISVANLQSNVAHVDKPISMWFDKLGLPIVIDSSSENVLAETATELSDMGRSTGKVKMSVANLQSNVANVDKPISMWFDKLSLPIVIDSMFMNSCTMDKCNEASGKLLEISTQSAVRESASNRNPKEDLSLSFVKHSSILKAIESMEIFQKMPQKPHFHDLDKSKEMYLEGLAIGYMVTFVNVVEQTSKLQISDSKRSFDNIFEALFDLESHGFDVKTVRSRLTELQSIKERQHHLQVQVEEYESQILKLTNEQLEVVAGLDNVVKEIKMLEEKKVKLTSMKEKNEFEIAALKSNVNVVSGDVQNAELEFESVVVAPW